MSHLPSSIHSYLRYFLTVFSLLSVNCAFAQIIPGTVTNNAKPVDGAIITNLHSKRMSMSGASGNFIMPVKKGDTLLTDYEGFKTDTVIYKDQNELLIALKPLPTLLDEVTIWERSMSPLDKFQEKQDEYYQIYRIGDKSNWMALSLSLMMNPFSNHFSKEIKNARHLQKTLLRDYHDDIIDTRFTKGLVAKITGYEGKQLENFMIDNRPSFEFIEHASDYDVMEYIIKAKKGETTHDNVAVNKNDK
ncbi:hypothetical protein [Mucilaginibacter sp. dw_454]|uniref:hypothetical protein n=1 Tax=Mucilaginibacter sp. dw_454 TaxID=2720079 RepID=UPI001BD6510D|nr:hypothetical protein [Mucilaginibacter sp. dw_454]